LTYSPLPAPNLSRTFTLKELSKFDGSDADKPIYVAIKGKVFDVSAKKAMYGPEGGYRCFAGRDASKVKKYFSLVTVVPGWEGFHPAPMTATVAPYRHTTGLLRSLFFTRSSLVPIDFFFFILSGIHIDIRVCFFVLLGFGFELIEGRGLHCRL